MHYYALSSTSLYTYLALIVPAMLLGLFAQIKVKSAYKKYRQVQNSRGLNGAQAAARVLAHYGVTDVSIRMIQGELTDNFNPKNKVISLSPDIYAGTSVAAVGIACHEAGHAAQYAEGYAPIRVRNAIIPVCNIGSWAGIPLALLGYFLSFEPLIYIGLGLYALIALFQLVTLPVEFNASARALQVINETGMLTDESEQKGAKSVLQAAALTYVAALVTTLATLLRFVIMLTGGKRRN